MSFSTMRQNWLNVVTQTNQDPIFQGFSGPNEAASQLANDYHNTIINASVGDPVGNKVITANNATVQSLLVVAFTGFKPLSTFINLINQAFSIYWAGATLTFSFPFPPTIIGVSNSAVSASPLSFTLPWSEDANPGYEVFIDNLIDALEIQLTTVTGLYTGIPPGAPPPPPIPISWTGYTL